MQPDYLEQLACHPDVEQAGIDIEALERLLSERRLAAVERSGRVWSKKQVAALMRIIAQIFNHQGDRLMGEGDTEAGRRSFHQRDTWWAESAKLYAQAGDEAAARQDPADAQACFQAAAGMLDPTLPRPWPDDFDPDSANEQLNRALAGGQSASLWRKAAAAAEASNDMDQARRALNTALTILEAARDHAREAARLFAAQGDALEAAGAQAHYELFEADMAGVQTDLDNLDDP